MKLSVLILAAGGSSRLGTPKQLIEFEEQTLIERVTEIALEVSENVLVVLGANAEQIKPKLDRFSDVISILHHSNWQEGMGSSIRAGVEKLAPDSDFILILLTDQPFISKVLLQKILQISAKTQSLIVSCVYNNELGVPMLFEKSLFSELLQLKGDKGAKSFLHRYNDKISAIDFPEGSFDIDTLEDVQKMLNS